MNIPVWLSGGGGGGDRELLRAFKPFAGEGVREAHTGGACAGGGGGGFAGNLRLAGKAHRSAQSARPRHAATNKPTLSNVSLCVSAAAGVARLCIRTVFFCGAFKQPLGTSLWGRLIRRVV